MTGRVSAQASGREWAVVVAIAAASLAVRAVFAASLGIFQDEALHWWWAHDEGVTFSPQPPGIALLARWGEAIVGHSALALRLGSLVCGTGAIVLAALLAREFYGGRAAVWAAALFATCPLLAGVSAISTPDAPVVFVWLLFVWVTWRAARSDRLGWWVACGAVLAVGGYTKYMMALAVPCAFLGLCASAGGRRLLKRPGPWVAVGMAAALFGSVFVAWNAQHGWPALRYHLAARHVWQFEWARVGLYLGGHAAAISPVAWIGVLAAFAGLWRRWRRRGRWRDAWLLAFGLVPILFFLAPSLFTKRHLVRVHWDLIGYAVGIVALAGLIAGGEGAARRRKLGLASVAIGALITVALFAASFWPAIAVAAGARPPSVRMLGWEELAARVREMEEGQSLSAGEWDEPHFILTGSFDSALCLAFHRGSRKGIYTIRSVHDERYGLTRQLEAWGIDEESAMAAHFAREAILIHEFRRPEEPGPEDQPRRVYRYFEVLEGRTGDRNWLTRHELEPLAEARVTLAGRTVRRFGLYRAHQQLLPP